MYRFKSIKLYFFSILKFFFSNFKEYYFSSNFYNKKLSTLIPTRFFYYPSSYLSGSLTTAGNDFYKINYTSPELLWKMDYSNKLQFDNLHGFLWLVRLDRKNSKIITKNIIDSWINIFSNYEPNTWKMEIMAKRIIAWSSNADITLENADKVYKEKFFLSLVKQANFLIKNLKDLNYSSKKIICCSGIILSGMIFKEYELNYKIGIKELEKIIKYFFDDDGFPKSRNPEDVFISIKYLILIREWMKEAQKPIPDFLNEIIQKCGKCYSLLVGENKQFPLFNGSSEINHDDYDRFLKNLKYKFNTTNHEIGGFIKVKRGKLEFFIDCGNPPHNNFASQYQAGCLSFELISNKQKVICNTGYGKYSSSKLKSLSRVTAAHSTLYLNNTSSCTFEKNKTINKMYGSSLVEKHKIIKKNYIENNDFYEIIASHNGYEKKFGYTHTRLVKILKNEDKIFGQDELTNTGRYSGNIIYFIRFHIYPNTKIIKTKGGNSVLISLSNGEGWLLKSESNNLEIEKNIFLGNKNRMINNQSILVSGYLPGNLKEKEVVSIKWIIEKIS